MTLGKLAWSSVEPSPALRGLSGTIPSHPPDVGFRSPDMANQTTAPVSSSNDDASSFLYDRLELLVLLVCASAVIVLVVLILARECCKRKYGIEMCNAIRRRSHSHQRGDTYDADRALAEQLQRQVDEEDQEADRQAKRKDRLRWYEYYMNDSSMIVEIKDLFHGKDVGANCSDGSNINDMEEVPNNRRNKEQLTSPRIRAMSTGDTSEDEYMFDTEDEDIEENGKLGNHSSLVICDENDVNGHLYLKLPPKLPPKKDENKAEEPSTINPAQGQCSEGTVWPCMGIRHVDGQCALCIDNYEEGDTVVWSPLDCTHAFHKECIFQWLGKGKKRCPVCRHWFVPGSRIDDQKKAHGEAWERASAEMERRENEHGGAATGDQHEPQQPAQDNKEQESSENTEPSDNTDVSNPDQHFHDLSIAVETKTESKVDDLPYERASRKSSETSEIDGMHLGEYEATVTTSPPNSIGELEMDGLESQQVAYNIVQNQTDDTNGDRNLN